MWQQITQWDWNTIKAIGGVGFGAVSAIVAIIQTIRYRKLQEVEYRRFWEIARTAHAVMAKIERIKSLGLDKMTSASVPPQVWEEWGGAHSTAKELIKAALTNVFLQHGEFTRAELNHFKSTHALYGYILQEFEAMMLTPPKKNWWPTMQPTRTVTPEQKGPASLPTSEKA
jgi:hypothetical protein